MEIRIGFSKDIYRYRKRLRNNCYGAFWYTDDINNSFIELCTKQYRSTIRTLIHEIHHQVLYEIENETTCKKYDKIDKKLEKYIFN